MITPPIPLETNDKSPEKGPSNPNLDVSPINRDSDTKNDTTRHDSIDLSQKLDLSDIKSQPSIPSSKRNSVSFSNELKPQDLTFESFYRTDISQISLSVVGTETKIFSHVVIRTLI